MPVHPLLWKPYNPKLTLIATYSLRKTVILVFRTVDVFSQGKKPCNISISKKKTVLCKASFRRRTHHVHHLKEILTRIKKSFLVRASKKIPFIDKTSHSQSKGKRQKGFFVMGEPIIVSIHHYNFPSSSCTFGVILFEPFLP